MGSHRVGHDWSDLAAAAAAQTMDIPLCFCMHAKSPQQYPTLYDPIDYSPPGSSVQGILQARVLEWIATLFSGRSSWPRDQTHVSYISCIGRQVLYHQHHLGSRLLCVSVQFSSVTQSCPTLCDIMNLNTPGLPVHHQLPEFTQTHVHRVGGAIQPSHPLSSLSPPAPIPPSIRVFSNESTLLMR